MADLKEKVVLITGASSGIGAGTAVYFAKLGAWLTLTGRNKVNLEGVATQCQEAGLAEDKILTVIGDVTDSDFRKSLIEETVRKFGRLDVLVNNAGVPVCKDAGDVTEAEYDLVLHTNLKAPFFLSQLALPHLQCSSGCIINVSSIFSTMTVPQYSVYAATKAALDSFTRSMAFEFAPKGVRVNSINPGLVRTADLEKIITDKKKLDEFYAREAEKTPLRRNGGVEEMGQAMAYLAGSHASFLTGHHLVLSGGRHLAYVDFSQPDTQ